MTTTTETTTTAPPAEWLEDIAAVLTATDRLTPTEVAGGLAALGIPVLPTIPGGKDPLLSARHIDGVNTGTGEKVGTPCPRCHEWHLRPTRDHGATTDPETIGRYWGAHPEAGVGMKNHPRLIRGDGDHETREELKHSREAIGYGQPFGVPDPFEANTPGGTYRRRYLHYVPEGLPSAGGGTRVHGVSWYGNSGYVVVKGQHPNGHEYPRFYGTITELPETVALALARRVTTEGGQGGAPAASSASVRQFLETYTGTNDPRRLEYRQRAINSAAVGSRHLTAAGQLVIGFREALAGYYPARVLVEIIAQGLRATGWDDARFEAEWDDLQGWALGQIAHLTPETARADIGRRMAELSANALLARAEEYPPELTGEEYEPPTDEAIARALAEYDRWEERSRSSSSAGTDDGDRPPFITFRELPDPFVLPPLEWHARGFLVAPTHGEMAGPEKSLKSYIGTAVDVGLAAGKDVLGYWETTKQHRVLVLIGEGGENGYLRRLQRIAEAYGVSVGDLRPWLRYSTQTAPTTSPRFIGGLQAALDQFQPDLVHLDPWYAYHSAEVDARSLYEQGAALERVGGLVREGGASLIINNHFNQTGTGNGLRRISMAGHAEWCDSWWLLDHRQNPDVANGRFRLKMEVGSRQWGGGSFEIDFNIGRHDLETNEHAGQISWKVGLPSSPDPDEDRPDPMERQLSDCRVELVKHIQRLKKREARTASDWLDLAPGHRNEIRRAAFAQLVDDGRFLPEEQTYKDKAGRTRVRTVYTYVPNLPSGAKGSPPPAAPELDW